jgi:hypothetical protein
MFMSWIPTFFLAPRAGLRIPLGSRIDRVFARITVVPSSNCVKSTRSPALRPRALRISAGIVI